MRRIGVLMAVAADDPEFQARVGAFLQGLAAIGLDRSAATCGSTPAGPRAIPPHSQTRGGIGRARAGRHLGLGGSAVGAVAAGDPHRADRVRDYRRSGRRRLRRQPGAARRQRHRLYGSSNTASAAKWLELLKEIAPGVTRVAVLRDAAMPPVSGQFAVIQAVAPSLGVEVSPIDVRDAGEIERAVAAFARRVEWRSDRDGERLGDVSSRSDHHAGGSAQAARGLLSTFLRSRLAAWSPMGPITSISTGALQTTLTASSRARSRPTCRCRRRPSTSWRSTSRPPRRSASKCRRRCSPAPTR